MSYFPIQKCVSLRRKNNNKHNRKTISQTTTSPAVFDVFARYQFKLYTTTASSWEQWVIKNLLHNTVPDSCYYCDQ